jgi:hypothetical protein
VAAYTSGPVATMQASEIRSKVSVGGPPSRCVSQGTKTREE